MKSKCLVHIVVRAYIDVLNFPDTPKIKLITELSKKMRLDISAAVEPVKPLDIPAFRDVKDKPAGKVLFRGKNQVPQIG